MAYSRTTATEKIIGLTKRIRAIAGGTSASKTISILMWLINYAQTRSNKIVSVTSETMPHLRKGAMRDFLLILKQNGYYEDDRWNRSDSTYKFANGSLFEFFPADRDRSRGPRRDMLFINEANNINFETYTQLEIRTNEAVWLDWNPINEFWFYTEVQHQDNVDFITLTYKDNEALNSNIVEAIERKKTNTRWWKVYGLGELGDVEGRVYKDWQIIEKLPHEARLERYGLDFGYSNDPTALIGVYHYNGGFIFDEVLYQTGLSNKQIADVINNEPKSLIIADSAEPKSIDELKSYGCNILAANKGQGSVQHGIQYVQSQRCSITQRSVNLIKEYRNYLYLVDKSGKITNEPSPIWNHGLDAIRYALESYQHIEDEYLDIQAPNPWVDPIIRYE